MNGIDLPRKRSDIQPLDGQYKTGRRDSSLGTALCVSTMCLPDGTARDKISQASPPLYFILEAMKYGQWERPGNEARIQGWEMMTFRQGGVAHPWEGGGVIPGWGKMHMYLLVSLDKRGIQCLS